MSAQLYLEIEAQVIGPKQSRGARSMPATFWNQGTFSELWREMESGFKLGLTNRVSVCSDSRLYLTV